MQHYVCKFLLCIIYIHVEQNSERIYSIVFKIEVFCDLGPIYRKGCNRDTREIMLIRQEHSGC